jgi:hypothetical protein
MRIFSYGLPLILLLLVVKTTFGKAFWAMKTIEIELRKKMPGMGS